MALKIKCPCGQELITDNDAAGRQVRCPRCQKILQVPMPQGAVRPAPPTMKVPKPGSGTMKVPPVPPPLPSGSGSYPAPPPLPPSPNNYDEPILEPELEEEGVAPGPPPQVPPQQQVPPQPQNRRILEEDEEYLEELRRERRKKKKRKKSIKIKKQQFKLVNLGLIFYYIKVIAIISAILLAISSAFLAAGMGSAGGLGQIIFVIGILVSFVVIMVAPMLGIVGGILCCFVPPKSGGRPLILTSVALDAMALMIGTVISLVLIISPSGNNPIIRNIVDGATFLLGLGSFIMFMLFIRKLSYYMDDDGTAAEAYEVMIAYIFGFSIPVAAVAIVSTLTETAAVFVVCVFAGFSFFGSLYWIWFMIKLLIRYLNLLNGMRAVLIARTGI